MVAARLQTLGARLGGYLRRPDVRVALAATLALRLGTGLFIAVLLAAAPGPYADSWRFVAHQPPGIKIATIPGPILSGLPGFVTTPWIHWDAVYYVRLATRGYLPGEGAFLPLYPALAHVAGATIGGHFTLGALLIATGATFCALLLLYRLALRLGASPQAASCTVAVAATLPLAFYIVAPYAEALFLALALATILAALERQWGRAALFAAGASLTRQQGPLLGLLAVPALVGVAAMIARDRRTPLRSRLLVAWRAGRGPLLLLVAGGMAYLGWLVVLQRLLGGTTPFELLTSSSGWGQHFTLPGPAVVADLAAIWRNPAIAVANNVDYALDAAAALIGLAGLLLGLRRLPTGLWLYLAACWGVALIKVDGDGYTTSAARYLLALLPLTILPAARLTRARLAPRLAYFGLSLGLFGYYFGQWLLWGWVS
jgi:hypothetical protein